MLVIICRQGQNLSHRYLSQAQIVAIEEHCQGKLLAADKRTADTVAEAAAAAALATQRAADEAALHVKAVQELQDEARASIQVQQSKSREAKSYLLFLY